MADLDLRREGKPVVTIDVPAVVSQFLSELSTFDLVVELVQNDLDAGATRTELSFFRDRIECLGNGAGIDAKGWKRLAVILGAGTAVQPKLDGIGSKNHGLKSAFLFGDNQIVVQSAGNRIDLTARGNLERQELFYPAAWPRIVDPSAPARGTRITVPLRTSPVEVPEQNPLVPLTPHELAALFQDAVERAADRFICASAPGRRWAYTLDLATEAHTHSFRYECIAAPDQPGFWLRTCTLVTSGKRPSVVARRMCSPFRLELNAADRAKVPRLYRRGGALVGEISWIIGDKSKPIPQDGGFRYPIAYPLEHVSTGAGFDISGPFISGRARHTMSDDARNGLIKAAGENAFVELMKRRIVPEFGPEALILASSASRTDLAVEERIAKALVEQQAFAILVRSASPKAKRNFGIGEPNGPTILAIPTYTDERIAARLAGLGAVIGQTLHPNTPQAFVRAAHRLLKAGNPNLRGYSEVDAAEDVLVRGRPDPPGGFKSWLARCADVIAELELGRSHGTLPKDYLKNVRTRAFLPTADGGAGEWNRVRRAKKSPPQVPGVAAPLLLHPTLAKASLLRDGLGKVAPFEIDEYLSRLNFAPTGAGTRDRFFGWLRTGHSALKPKTLVAISNYPIWPSVKGSHKALNYYCLPRAQYLRDILAEVREGPHPSLVAFPGLRRSSNGSLRLRATPTEDELADWHGQAMSAAVTAQEQGTAEAATIIARTEAALVKLRTDGFPVARIAAGHQSMSKAGRLREVGELHIENAAVAACHLLPQDLAHVAPQGLLEHLGAQTRSGAAAVVRALREQPRADALFARLAAYRAHGLDLEGLADEQIVLVKGTLRAPSTLCFRSSIDWWGSWKLPLDYAPLVPEHVDLLEQVGVVRASLREDWSRGFFDWIAEQPNDVQLSHLQQVIRHWGERKAGPSRWIDRNLEKKCVPVYDRNGNFELQSMKAATSSRSLTFLPDFEGLDKQVLDDNARLRLAIVEVAGVDGSIIDLLRKAGVRSLRDLAGDPVRTETSSEIAADPDLERELALVKSRTSDLPKRLARKDVDTTMLRHKWRWLLSELKGVRTAQRLTAIYGLFGREYERPTAGGVDLITQQLCVIQGAERLLRFYAALARHLFLPGTSELYAYGLMMAVHSEKQADLFGDLDSSRDEPEFADDDEDDEVVPKKGHSGITSGAPNSAPAPKPLAPITNPTYVRSEKRSRSRSQSATSSRRNSLEEAEHILQLKENHYAWHCQACLGALDVEVATPPGTYVFLAQERKTQIEAHHVRHLQNSGDLGGENLLILCHYHHRLLGDSLSRDAVLAALAKPTPTVRRFPIGEGGANTAEYSGSVVTLELQTNPHQISLFFTPEHAQAWHNREAHKKQKDPRSAHAP